jgi:hypothetical protein
MTGIVICNPVRTPVGRIAALGTGVPGLQIDHRCGSGLRAVLYGARCHDAGPHTDASKEQAIDDLCVLHSRRR